MDYTVKLVNLNAEAHLRCLRAKSKTNGNYELLSIAFSLIFIHFPTDSVTKTSTPSFSKNGKAGGQQGAPWETLVVFAINLKQLTVQMNMSNVMGNNT